MLDSHVKIYPFYCPDPKCSTFYCRCAGCRQIVSKTDLVFRIRSSTFHLDCFRCTVCDRLFQSGEEVALQDDRLSCLKHGQSTLATSTPGLMSPTSVEKRIENELLSYSCPILDSKQKCNSSKGSVVLNKLDLDKPEDKSNSNLLPALLRTTPDLCSSNGTRRTKFELDDKLRDVLSSSKLTYTIVGDISTCNRRFDPLPSMLTEGPMEFSESFCPSPPHRPNSPGSSLGVVLRDTDSPLTPNSELSPEEENRSLLGLSHSTSHMLADLGVPNRTGVGTSPAGTSGTGCITQSSCGLNTTPGLIGSSTSRTGSGSCSSETSATSSCGDEVVHNVPMVRSNMSRSTKTGGSRRSKDQKPTRVRTVLNEKQLHTLRTCYAANPRPDALMKEQLVEMTSLSPRVIRVWFQNKRCKDKKRQILLKQMEEQQQQNGGRPNHLHGISMIAGSPIRNDVGLVCPTAGLDIQQVSGPYWTSDATRPTSICSTSISLDPRGGPYSGHTHMSRDISPTRQPISMGPSNTLPGILIPPNARTLIDHADAAYPIWSIPEAGGSNSSEIGAYSLLASASSDQILRSSGSAVSTMPSDISASPGGRFTLPLLSTDFQNRPSATSAVPAFQQLVSHFDPPDNPAVSLSNNQLTFTSDFIKLTDPVDPALFPNDHLSRRSELGHLLRITSSPTTSDAALRIDRVSPYQSKVEANKLLPTHCSAASSISRLAAMSQEPGLFPICLTSSSPHQNESSSSPVLNPSILDQPTPFGIGSHAMHTGFPHLQTLASPMLPPARAPMMTAVPPASLLTLTPRASLST